MRIETNPAYNNNREVAQFLRNLPQRFCEGGTAVWRKRNEIRLFQLGGKDGATPSLHLAVKRFGRLNIIKKIIYSLSKSKARKAFLNSMELRRRGFLTPDPVACVEERKHGLITGAYYVSLATDWPPIADELEKSDWNRPLAVALARFAAHLHEQGVIHDDFNKTNVLYNKVYVPDSLSGEQTYRFQLIDNNRMRFLSQGSVPTDEECMENLTRFTGDISLFAFVVSEYATARGLDPDEWTRRAIRQKRLHDRNWRRRKAITHPIRTIRRNRKLKVGIK